MRLIIVSGLSGSGKSVALNVLEDLGYYCIDNIPVALAQSFVDEILPNNNPAYNFVALGLDGGGSGAPEILDLLRAMLTDERDVIPLGPIGYELREAYEGRLIDAGVEQALERLTEARRAVAPPLPPATDAPAPEPDPVDTLGSGP